MKVAIKVQESEASITMKARDWIDLQRRHDELAIEVESLRRENERLRQQVDDDE